MVWERVVQSAEALMVSNQVPASEEIISLIKRINPTARQLSEADRERGYLIKNRLQNLLLENYGGAFYLAPHPYTDEIVLIKHSSLPSIDACHTHLSVLSVKALQSAGSPPEPPLPKSKPHKEKAKKQAEPAGSAADLLKRGQLLLEEYDYPEAEKVLAELRLESGADLETLAKAARLLLDELGAYSSAVEMLLAQPRKFLKERSIRELLALAYYRNENLAEAGMIFDALLPADLGKEALLAWASLSHRDGNDSFALQLIRMAEEREGFLGGLAELRKAVEGSLEREAEPLFNEALAAVERGDLAAAALRARQALQVYPGLAAAREILEAHTASKERDELSMLWQEFRATESCEARLDLLARLQERDTEKRETIRELVAHEKARRKKEQLASELKSLETLAAGACWGECFDVLLWFSRQEDPQWLKKACTVSRLFSVLSHNQRLFRLPERAAREAWLDFVKAKSALERGNREACFQLLEGVRHYFHGYPEFSEDYLMLLGAEQERARREIDGLLQQARSKECGSSTARRLLASARKRLAILPDQERSELTLSVDECEAGLPPERAEEELVRAYKAALIAGNGPKAEMLRRKIHTPALLERAEAKVRERFRIQAEPVTLTYSDQLPLDDIQGLDTKAQPLWYYATDRHVLLNDRKGHIVVANLQQGTATRFYSPMFPYLVACDDLPYRDTFLFVYGPDVRYMLRADLHPGQGSFTALLNLRKNLGLDKSTRVVRVYLSSERDTDYYLSLAHEDHVSPGRLVKRRIGSKNPIPEGLQLNNQPFIDSRRLTCAPDSFVAGVTDETHVINKNLSSEGSVEMTPEIWGVDPANRRMYYFYSVMLKRVDFKFDNYQEFPLSGACFFFRKSHLRLGFSPSTDTVLLMLKERLALYNYRTNRITRPFGVNRILGLKPANNWYLYEYRHDSSELILRDLTGELDTVYQWEDIPDLREDRSYANSEQLHELIYLGYEPDPEPAEATAGEATAGEGAATGNPLTMND
ncbi:hypothetical protein GMST_35200 [Geomonas silvestris]|uniref:Uncharacterized protein n=1 Tax=Geomonas silvestris TaxID=2740184 RepID=A0A6V8MMC0_9BACT|nr:hypothetical protein [Geomonas silvestris]GFO61195.1 hypothetical protein GMST_35200 [Geomonas silvestris]